METINSRGDGGDGGRLLQQSRGYNGDGCSVSGSSDAAAHRDVECALLYHGHITERSSWSSPRVYIAVCILLNIGKLI